MHVHRVKTKSRQDLENIRCCQPTLFVRLMLFGSEEEGDDVLYVEIAFHSAAECVFLPSVHLRRVYLKTKTHFNSLSENSAY